MLDPCPALVRAPLTGDVTIAVAPATGRLLLRCRTAPVEALQLGPDSWLILTPSADQPALLARLEAALAGVPHALVDIGHRQTALLVSGPRAADTLNAGCPLDLSRRAFPVGMCTRTLLGKAEITLWRTGADAFHLEIARSFAPYAWDFLAEAAREFRG